MEIKNLEHFKKLVQKGKIKDKWYFYKRTEEQKQNQTHEMEKLIEYFKEHLNLLLYPISGTLLGMSREKDFILHDNDVDLAYLSNQHEKSNVLEEFYQICDKLKKENLLSKICRKGQLHCYGQSKTFKYDIWTSFIMNNQYYLVPLIDGDLMPDTLLPLKKIIFRKVEFFVPNQTEKILDYIYKDWKVLNYNLGSNLKWINIL
ncbi:MAG: hypothetical protein WC554_16910 [Clostridia bacterium]